MENTNSYLENIYVKRLNTVFFFRSTTIVHCERNLSKSKYIFPLYLQIIALVTWLFSFLIYLQNILRADKAILI